MKDRNVQHASRFRLTKVPGTDDVYDLIPAPGEVYEEGTLINKSALLKDATAALFGLDENAVPDDALALIKQMIDSNYSELFSLANSKAKIATGSYNGTGNYGESNPNSLTFGFEPKLVFMFEDGFPVSRNVNSQTALPVYGTTIGMTTAYSVSLFNIYSKDNYFYAKKSRNGKTLSWYHEASAKAQMNVSGVKYQYIAIG